MKDVHFAIAMSLLIALTGAVAGQVQQALNRSVNGRPDTDIQIGVYVNVNPDCTSGPLPSIQLISPPEHGNVSVKQGKWTATNYKQCLAVEVPAFVAFYRSRSDFEGIDVVLLEVKYAGGKTELQKISVIVSTGTGGKGT